MEVCNTVKESVTKNHPKEKETQEGKMVEEALQIAEERRKAKGREKGKDIPNWKQNSRE